MTLINFLILFYFQHQIKPSIVKETVATSGVETSLIFMIDNNQFGSRMANDYLTWSQLIMDNPSIRYQYSFVKTSPMAKVIREEFSGECSYPAKSDTAISKIVVNSNVDLVAKKNELKDMIKSGKRFMLINHGSSFYIKSPDGKILTIDTRYPLEANPVSVQEVGSPLAEVFQGAVD